MGFGGGGSSSSTTVKKKLPKYIKKPYRRNIADAEALKNTPFQAYNPNARVAPLTADELAAYELIRNEAGMYRPYLDDSLDRISKILDKNEQAPTADVLEEYMNPYLEMILDRSLHSAEREYDTERQKIGDYFETAGAFGGGRQAIMEDEITDQYLDRILDLEARERYNAYSNALGQYNYQNQFGVNTALSQADLANSAQQHLANQAGLLEQAGQNQRRVQQALADAKYEEFLRKEADPYKKIGFMQQILNPGMETQTGYTENTTTKDNSSPFGKILGTALNIGAAMATGGASIPMSTAFGASLPLMNSVASGTPLSFGGGLDTIGGMGLHGSVPLSFGAVGGQTFADGGQVSTKERLKNSSMLSRLGLDTSYGCGGIINKPKGYAEGGTVTVEDLQAQIAALQQAQNVPYEFRNFNFDAYRDWSSNTGAGSFANSKLFLGTGSPILRGEATDEQIIQWLQPNNPYWALLGNNNPEGSQFRPTPSPYSKYTWDTIPARTADPGYTYNPNVAKVINFFSSSGPTPPPAAAPAPAPVTLYDHPMAHTGGTNPSGYSGIQFGPEVMNYLNTPENQAALGLNAPATGTNTDALTQMATTAQPQTYSGQQQQQQQVPTQMTAPTATAGSATATPVTFDQITGTATNTAAPATSGEGQLIGQDPNQALTAGNFQDFFSTYLQNQNQGQTQTGTTGGCGGGGTQGFASGGDVSLSDRIRYALSDESPEMSFGDLLSTIADGLVKGYKGFEDVIGEVTDGKVPEDLRAMNIYDRDIPGVNSPKNAGPAGDPFYYDNLTTELGLTSRAMNEPRMQDTLFGGQKSKEEMLAELDADMTKQYDKTMPSQDLLQKLPVSTKEEEIQKAGKIARFRDKLNAGMSKAYEDTVLPSDKNRSTGGGATTGLDFSPLENFLGDLSTQVQSGSKEALENIGSKTKDIITAPVRAASKMPTEVDPKKSFLQNAPARFNKELIEAAQAGTEHVAPILDLATISEEEYNKKYPKVGKQKASEVQKEAIKAIQPGFELYSTGMKDPKNQWRNISGYDIHPMARQYDVLNRATSGAGKSEDVVNGINIPMAYAGIAMSQAKGSFLDQIAAGSAGYVEGKLAIPKLKGEAGKAQLESLKIMSEINKNNAAAYKDYQGDKSEADNQLFDNWNEYVKNNMPMGLSPEEQSQWEADAWQKVANLSGQSGLRGRYSAQDSLRQKSIEREKASGLAELLAGVLK